MVSVVLWLPIYGYKKTVLRKIGIINKITEYPADIAMALNNYWVERSIQEQIDRKMCRPGWTWNKTLKECMPAAVGYVEKPVDKPKPGPDLPDSGENGGNKGGSGENSADKAIKMEIAMRQSQGLRSTK